MYILRWSPCHGHSAVILFDNLLRSDVSFIINCKLSNVQWTQTSLTIRDGGWVFAVLLRITSLLSADLQALILGQSVVDQDKSVQLFHTWKPDHQTGSGLGTALSNNRTCRRSSPLILPLTTVHFYSLSTGFSFFQFRAEYEWTMKQCILQSNYASDSSFGRLINVHATSPSIPVVCVVCLVGEVQFEWFVISSWMTRIPRPPTCRYCFREGASRFDAHEWQAFRGSHLIMWLRGLSLTQDVTVVDAFAVLPSDQLDRCWSGLCRCRRSWISQIRLACLRLHFHSNCIENSRCCKQKALGFFVEVGRRITVRSNDSTEIPFLFQRLSVTIQRFNAVAFRGTFADDSEL